MKIKTSELTGTTLDWAVNQIEECCDDPHTPPFSTSWAQAGPIIERERMTIEWLKHDEVNSALDVWLATRIEGSSIWEALGPTPLVAAMRAFVASQLGDEIEIPEELTQGQPT
jgi:hypothetical protein